ncbi:hypothetical protein F4X10_20585 [Candidatus Poribacteria bacterium]|nr:hypothetical protein [Candidatus Poribacteria bacterium]
MKYTLFFCAAFFLIISPTFGELTSQDLDKIRFIVKEEISEVETRLRAEIAASETLLREEIAASETRMKEYVDTKFNEVDTKFKGVDIKFEELDKRIILVVGFVSGLIILIVVTIGIPQIIIAWRGQNERSQDRKIEELSREIEALKQRHIVGP